MCNRDQHNLIVIMTTEVMMMMKIMIVKNYLPLQNLQAFLDLEIIAEKTSSCHGTGQRSNNVSESTYECVQKTDHSGTTWQLSGSGNNAQDKLIFGVCWFLQIFMHRLIIMMLV